MKHVRNSLAALASIVALVGFIAVPRLAPAQAVGLTFTRIDVPGAVSTEAFGINDYGQIVGYYRDATGTVHGYVLNDGVFTRLDYPGANSTFAYGINKAGQIVGRFDDSTGMLHGFVLDQGTYFTQIDFPGAVTTVACGINDHGQIVGYFGDGQGFLHGFLLDNSVFSQIDFPGVSSTIAFGINRTGQIVGAGGAHGFLLNHESFTQIDFLGAQQTVSQGINNSGQNRFKIVGWFNNGGTFVHGFIRDNKNVSTTIDFPVAAATWAFGINTKDEIVGSFLEPGGSLDRHGFVAK
jgi:probable HAF family extracellular repeat protein